MIHEPEDVILSGAKDLHFVLLVAEYIYLRHSAKQVQDLNGAGNMTFSSEKTLYQYRDLKQTLKVEGDVPNLVLAVFEKTKE